MSLFDKKTEKKKVDEAMVDQIVKEANTEKNLKERLYDKINIPIWLLDIIIVGCIVFFFWILIFKRTV